MELQKRKITRYKHANYSSAGAYFITICTKDRKKLLSYINSVGDGVLDVPQVELSDLGKIVDNQIAQINKTYKDAYIDIYVIMPDHVHMIIILNGDIENGTSRTPSPTITMHRQNETIPQIISTFKRFTNKQIGENIWQRSYNDHIIRNRDDYEEVKKYIYQNPIKWFYGEEEEKYSFEY